MEIVRCNREERDLPIELILPHNRIVKEAKKFNENEIKKNIGSFDFCKLAEENFKIAENLRKKLGQGIEEILESCIKNQR